MATLIFCKGLERILVPETGATNGDFLGPGGAKTGGWWRSLFGKRQEMSKDDHLGAACAAASPAPRTGPAAEARDRLARHDQRLWLRPLTGFGHKRQSKALHLKGVAIALSLHTVVAQSGHKVVSVVGLC